MTTTTNYRSSFQLLIISVIPVFMKSSSMSSNPKRGDFAASVLHQSQSLTELLLLCKETLEQFLLVDAKMYVKLFHN